MGWNSWETFTLTLYSSVYYANSIIHKKKIKRYFKTVVCYSVPGTVSDTLDTTSFTHVIDEQAKGPDQGHTASQ